MILLGEVPMGCPRLVPQVRCMCREERSPKKTKWANETVSCVFTNERLALDILSPQPVKDLENKYILVVADYASKWVEAFPLPNQEAQTVASLLVKEVICLFGVPLIHSDQGKNFQSALFTKMCQLLGMKKTRSTAYHLELDGMP